MDKPSTINETTSKSVVNPQHTTDAAIPELKTPKVNQNPSLEENICDNVNQILILRRIVKIPNLKSRSKSKSKEVKTPDLKPKSEVKTPDLKPKSEVKNSDLELKYEVKNSDLELKYEVKPLDLKSKSKSKPKSKGKKFRSEFEPRSKRKIPDLTHEVDKLRNRKPFRAQSPGYISNNDPVETDLGDFCSADFSGLTALKGFEITMKPGGSDSIESKILPSSELGQKLLGDFRKIKHLKIHPQESSTSKNSSSEIDLSSFTALEELEITLRNSDPINLYVPKKLKKFVMYIIEDPRSSVDAVQIVSLEICDSLETVIINGYRECFESLYFKFPLHECPEFTTFISNTRTINPRLTPEGFRSYDLSDDDTWFLYLRIIYISYKDELLPFLINSNGALMADKKKCPYHTNFSVFGQN